MIEDIREEFSKESKDIVEKVQENSMAYAIGLVDSVSISLAPDLKASVEKLVAMGYMKGWVDKTQEDIEYRMKLNSSLRRV